MTAETVALPTAAPVVTRVLSSRGTNLDQKDGDGSRWYADPQHPGVLHHSVTTALSMTRSKPYLTPWAAKLCAEFAVDHLDFIAETLKTVGREAALGMVKGAAQEKRDEASVRGTFVHDIVEAFILDSPLPDYTDDPDVQPYADAFVDWIIAWQPVFLAAEATVLHRRHGYAGTLDIIAWLPALGKTYLIDAKTGKQLDNDMPPQLKAYKEAEVVLLPNGEEAPMPHTDGVAVLHIRPGRAKLVDMTEDADEQSFAEFLDRLALVARYDSKPKNVGRTIYPLNPDGTPGSPWLCDILPPAISANLAAHSVITVADLAGCTSAEVRDLKGVGKVAIATLTLLLEEHHLSWRV